MKPKRILLIIGSLRAGGAERQFSGLAILLKQHGYDIKVITYEAGDFYLNVLVENGIDYEMCSELSSRITRPFKLARKIREWNPDVVISYLLSTNLSVCLSRLLIKFNLIVSERNTTQHITLREQLAYRLYLCSDYIVPNSYSQKKFLERNFSFLRNKIRVITNFTDISHFYPTYKTTNPVPVVLTLGRYVYQKNGLLYIRAISKLKEKGIRAKFVWYGDKTLECYNEMHDLVQELDLTDYIELNGPTRNPLDVYQNSDIFCLPSLYEGYPNVICEAMACGIPIACSNVCDNGTIVKEDINGVLFNPLSVDSIADSLEKILRFSKDELANIGKTNRKFIETNNSSDKFINEYIKLIECL